MEVHFTELQGSPQYVGEILFTPDLLNSVQFYGTIFFMPLFSVDYELSYSEKPECTANCKTVFFTKLVLTTFLQGLINRPLPNYLWHILQY